MESWHDTVETAWSNHRSALVRRLTALTRDSEVAEDLAQDAFLRLLREVQAGRTPNDPGAWLYRVSGNLAASRGRHLSVVDRRAGDLAKPESPASPEMIAVDAERTVALRAALATLIPSDRQALLLAAQGYRASEIAACLGRTPGATRTLLCRARSKLRGSPQLLGLGAA